MMLLIVPFAQAQHFEEVLQQSVTTFDSAKAENDRVTASNRLELIANKYPGKWAAAYYAAYSKAMIGVMEADNTNKDQYFDQADKYLEKAKTLATDNDENYVLAAMLASNRIGVDPQNRWQQYGQLFAENIQKAKAIRQDNPRLFYVQGLNSFFTPEQFGGGKKAALPYFEKSKTLYETETDSNILKPSWGKPGNTYFLIECQKQ